MARGIQRFKSTDSKSDFERAVRKSKRAAATRQAKKANARKMKRLRPINGNLDSKTITILQKDLNSNISRGRKIVGDLEFKMSIFRRELRRKPSPSQTKIINDNINTLRRQVRAHKKMLVFRINRLKTISRRK